jgi:raffinose/stachyose/melibiose transport system substrate-binding protein
MDSILSRCGPLNLTTRIWIVLIGVGVFALFTGERLLLRGSDPNLLRFAHTFTTASERAILDDAIAEFESRHPGLRIEQIISNSETYNTIGWRLQFHGRKQPDIFFHWQGFKVDYAIARGWAMDLGPRLSPGFVDQFVPATMRHREDGLYHLPQSIDISNLIWFDRDLFNRLNLREAASMEEWLVLCRELRGRDVLPLVQGNRDLWPMGNFGAELLGQSLGPERFQELFRPGVEITADDLAGLEPFVTLREQGGFDLPGTLEPGAIGSLGDIDAKVFFLSGKAAQHAIGSWFMADIDDARQRGELDFAIDVIPIPPESGRPDVMTAVTTGYLVNPKTRNPGAAVAFLELLLSRKYQERFAALGNLSARRDAREFTDDPLARRMLDFLAATPATVPPPDTGFPPAQAQVFYELCARLLTGRLDLEQAASYWNREKDQLARK